MLPSIHELLLKNDRVGEWEFPTDPPAWLDLSQVEALKPDLEDMVGRELDIDRNVQDASFLTDIGLLDERWYDRDRGTGALVYLFAIRFSNFGRMVTLHGTEWRERTNEWNVGKVIEFLVDHHFSYVPEDQLHSAYDGPNDVKDKDLTWWTRFFDYV